MNRTKILGVAMIASILLAPAAAHAVCAAKDLDKQWALTMSSTIGGATHANFCQLRGRRGVLQPFPRRDAPCAPGTIVLRANELEIADTCGITGPWFLEVGINTIACRLEAQMTPKKEQINGVLRCELAPAGERAWVMTFTRIDRAKGR